MGRYQAQHLFLKGSSLIWHTTVTSAGTEYRSQYKERAEVKRIGQQRRETEDTEQAHPKTKHSPFALPQHNAACQTQRRDIRSLCLPRITQVSFYRGITGKARTCSLPTWQTESLKEPASLISLLFNKLVINQEVAF